MKLLLDTDVLSETARDKPSPAVLAVLATQDRLRTSAVTVFELSRGVIRLRDGRRRQFLEAWLARLLDGPLDVLPYDREAALEAVRLEAQARSEGRAIDLRDLFILATGRANGLVVATRNTAHFKGFGAPVLDPFTGQRFF